MLNMTQHARTRLQQRGIPQDVLEKLLAFGNEVHGHRGSLVIYFNRNAREQLRAACGNAMYKRIESHLNAYAVISDTGHIVTVGHRTRRIIHH